MLLTLKYHLVWLINLKLEFNGDKMKTNLLRMTTLTLVGIQVIMLICMYALLWRVGVLESNHDEPVELKE